MVWFFIIIDEPSGRGIGWTILWDIIAKVWKFLLKDARTLLVFFIYNCYLFTERELTKVYCFECLLFFKHLLKIFDLNLSLNIYFFVNFTNWIQKSIIKLAHLFWTIIVLSWKCNDKNKSGTLSFLWMANYISIIHPRYFSCDM